MCSPPNRYRRNRPLGITQCADFTAQRRASTGMRARRGIFLRNLSNYLRAQPLENEASVSNWRAQLA
jgi:hypothetical protein